MSKSNNWEAAILGLLFNATPIANVAANASSGALTELFVSLHTADPGEAGAQNTSEVSYTGYARVGVARNGTGWVLTGNSISPAAPIIFGACTAGTGEATFLGIGTAASGPGVLLYSGPIGPSIAYAPGTTPELSVTTTITEE